MTEVHCVHVVRFDDYIEAAAVLGGEPSFSPESWQAAREGALEAFNNVLGSWASGCTLVIIDDNMHLRSMRHRCYQIARSRTAAFLQIHIQCPLSKAIERNRTRPVHYSSEGYQVPEPSVMRMAEAMEPPSTESWEHQHLIVSAEDLENDLTGR